MQEANAMGALGARGTAPVHGHSKPGRRGSRRLDGDRRSAWLLAFLASACGSPEDAATGALAEQALTFSGARAEQQASAGAYTLFEADPVRPIAVLDKSGLVAVTNTVDGYLEILRPTRRSAAPCGAVQVGLQPVAVAVVEEGASRAELWVVNRLSDSVSVIGLDTDDCRAEVTRTLRVGDEPRDIVVARDSSGRARVFVATAHRGQNHPPESARLGTDRILPPSEKAAAGLADVLVFDPAAPSAPPAVVNLFSDRPRALATADGVVHAASFSSGNRTTLIGHPHESRTTVVDPARAGTAALQPVHLHTHVDYSRCCDDDEDENAKSIAFPTAGVFSADGSRFSFSALGSAKIGGVSAAAALDAGRGRLYVKTHFDNQLVVIDTERERITGRVFLHDPECSRSTPS